jgi:hypothetical protein
VARVEIGGSYRLTTAFILGHALRAATGFELEIATSWATDDRPPRGRYLSSVADPRFGHADERLLAHRDWRWDHAINPHYRCATQVPSDMAISTGG